MATLQAKAYMQLGDRYFARSLIGSEFVCGIESPVALAETPALVPTASGPAWTTGTHEFLLDPDHP